MLYNQKEGFYAHKPNLRKWGGANATLRTSTQQSDKMT